MIYVAGNFNLNVLGYTTNVKVKNILDTTFEHGLIPVTNSCDKQLIFFI